MTMSSEVQRAGLDSGSVFGNVRRRPMGLVEHGPVIVRVDLLRRTCTTAYCGDKLIARFAQVFAVPSRAFASTSFRAAAALLIVFACAAPVHAQPPDWLLDGANATAIVAHAADAFSTGRCTAFGTCVERNKLLHPYVSGPDPKPKAFFAIKMGTAAASWFLKDRLKRKAPWWVLVFAGVESAAFFAVAAHNDRAAGVPTSRRD
jgi:hypothetical protein